AAFAATAALRARDATGQGQVVDVSIVESILSLLGGPLAAFDQTGVMPMRAGNRSPNNAPRNVYQTLDGHWVAVSASAQSIAERVMRLVGRDDLAEEPWFADSAGRVAHTAELDEAVGSWIADRTRDEVVERFEEAHAAVGPVYDFADILDDPHLKARDAVVEVPDPDLGAVRMPGLPFRLSRTPGAIRSAGPGLGEHTGEVLAEIGITAHEVRQLRERGVL
ncbi:CaiB/BaiF CoA transferase family protein, partial [Nocardiopsis rhodophaea]